MRACCIHYCSHVYDKEKTIKFYENDAMGLYFIADPEGNWIEILPEK